LLDTLQIPARQHGIDFAKKINEHCLARQRRPIDTRLEKLLIEGEDISATQKKGNVRVWKPLPNNGSADVTADIRVRVSNSEM
jgi:hypothetical protein